MIRTFSIAVLLVTLPLAAHATPECEVTWRPSAGTYLLRGQSRSETFRTGPATFERLKEFARDGQCAPLRVSVDLIEGRRTIRYGAHELVRDATADGIRTSLQMPRTVVTRQARRRVKFDWGNSRHYDIVWDHDNWRPGSKFYDDGRIYDGATTTTGRGPVPSVDHGQVFAAQSCTVTPRGREVVVAVNGVQIYAGRPENRGIVLHELNLLGQSGACRNLDARVFRSPAGTYFLSVGGVRVAQTERFDAMLGWVQESSKAGFFDRRPIEHEAFRPFVGSAHGGSRPVVAPVNGR